MSEMKVNFNSLRRHALDEFDAVVLLIKENISFLDETGPDFREELASRLDTLRGSLAVIASCHDDNGNDDVLGERILLSIPSEEEDFV